MHNHRSASDFQRLLQDMDVMIQFLILIAQFVDRPYRVQDRRVIASAKGLADRRIALRSQILGQPHGDLTRAYDLARTLL